LCLLFSHSKGLSDRIIAALGKVPLNQVQRLRLEVPQFSRALYSKIALIAPNIRFLEILEPFSYGNTFPTGSSFSPVQVDIPSGLLEFPHLGTVGTGIVCDFMTYADGNPDEALDELVKQVPSIKAIHCEDGLLLNVPRNPDGSTGMLDEISHLENSDCD
ncbi:hypothetical protein BDV93DRAFT_520065, partial [Ceratobasidium sp. AG-I]